MVDCGLPGEAATHHAKKLREQMNTKPGGNQSEAGEFPAMVHAQRASNEQDEARQTYSWPLLKPEGLLNPGGQLWQVGSVPHGGGGAKACCY